MANLVSPGVDINVIDESFFIPGRQGTVPLIFIATAERKTQSDGSTPALGTHEYGVVRTVTNTQRSLELYGVPNFLTDSADNPHHGDARNEYGLDALNKFLEIGNLAYVVRANVNLDDTLSSIRTLWTNKVEDAGDELNSLVADFIDEYNEDNNLVPADGGYKETVTSSELKPLVDEAMADVFACYSFSSTDFQLGFIQDHTTDHPGYHEALYDDSAGFIQSSDATGLNNDTTQYGFEISITDTGGTGTHVITIQGQNAQTFGDLITEMETAINSANGGSSTVEIISGNIRVTSDLSGATSQVEITNDGPSGTTALFANTNLFDEFGTPVQGVGSSALDVYDSDFTTITGSYDGLDALIDNWSSGGTVASEFTPSEAEGLLLSAADDYDNTKEFKNQTSLGANDAARRTEIVTQLQAAINDPDSLIRTGRFEYNLVVCPGYWETTDELLRLAQDMNDEVFVIGDTPFDKPPTGPSSINAWVTTNQVKDSSVAYYYPHGLSSNVDGVEIMTSAAASALRVYALNDDEAELWFAPAGATRGAAPHLTDIGYVQGNLGSATTFVSNDISRGLRDVLFEDNINPFTRIIDRGILVFAQNTTNPTTSDLSKVNVSRLVKYIRRELRKSLFDFLFEPNDSQTRQSVKSVVDSFLGGLVGRRALNDFASQVDEENNPPDVVDQNELIVDIALKPTGAVEFLTVNLRLVRQDADIG